MDLNDLRSAIQEGDGVDRHGLLSQLAETIIGTVEREAPGKGIETDLNRLPRGCKCQLLQGGAAAF